MGASAACSPIAVAITTIVLLRAVTAAGTAPVAAAPTVIPVSAIMPAAGRDGLIATELLLLLITAVPQVVNAATAPAARRAGPVTETVAAARRIQPIAQGPVYGTAASNPVAIATSANTACGENAGLAFAK
jgi:hypothetical protein